MKKLIIIIVAIVCASTVSAQNIEDYKAFMKERKEVQKLSKDERTAKVSREVKKQAKAFEKEGWKVPVGALPLEKQIEKSQLMSLEYDIETDMPKYIVGYAQATGTSYDAAKMQATADAKSELAGNIQTEVAELIDVRLANSELEDGQAASLNEAVQVSKQMIAQSLGRVITVIECYREPGKGKYEVQVRILYNNEMAQQAAKKAIKEELQKKGDKLADDLDKLLGF